MMDRRRFLQTAAAGAGAFLGFGRPERAEVKIERLEFFPVLYPTTGFFKFLAGPGGRTGRPAVVVKITAGDGTVGWGQSVPLPSWSDETLETATLVLREYFAPALVGRSPLDIAGAHAALDKALAPGFSTAMPVARAGIDLALHDLAGKFLGQSVAQMWGKPSGGPIVLSWTVNVLKAEEAAAVVEAGKKRGYQHFNLKVAPDPELDAALAREVRRLAPQAFIWADANGGYDLETALKAAPRLAEAGVNVLEAPFRPNQISAYQLLKKQGALPIFMDEGVVSRTELEEFNKLGMLDGLAVKHARSGGLPAARSQIDFCRGHDLQWLGSGLTDPDISLAAALALFGAYGLTKPAALNGPQFLAADILKKPLRVEHGLAYPPKGPGLGVEVDEAKLAYLLKRSPGKS
jgi:L-alanine-DL-glutamate epimerase-like enolase superfamily enzyme